MVSLKPTDAVEGGGLLDDCDVTFGNPRFEMWDYQGQRAAVPALLIDLVPLDEDDGSETTQAWSAGKATDWAPSDDGMTLEAIGNATALNRGTNMMFFIGSLIDAGFPEEDLGDDISVLEGLCAHVRRLPAPPGRTKRDDGKELTILAVESIIEEEDPKPKKKAAKKTAAKPAKKAAAKRGRPKKAEPEEEAAGEDEIEEQAQTILVEILGDFPDGVAKRALPTRALPKMKEAGLDKDTKNAVVRLLCSEDFLATEAMWSYANGQITS